MMNYNNIVELIKDLEAYKTDAFQGREMTKEEVISVTTGAIELLKSLSLEQQNHNIGIALLSKILGGDYADYDSVELTEEERLELEKRVMDEENILIVEGIVNRYLIEIGFNYGESEIGFLR